MLVLSFGFVLKKAYFLALQGLENNFFFVSKADMVPFFFAAMDSVGTNHQMVLIKELVWFINYSISVIFE